jgi:hypothetical protein
MVFDPAQGPVTISSVSKGVSFEVFQAMQGQTPVGAYRIDWTRSGAGIQTVVGHAHAAWVVPFARLNTTVASYAGRFIILSDFWNIPTYDSAFRTGETEWLIKNKDKHEASHLLFPTKKIIAMAVSVSTAVQGPTVPHTNYNERAPFERMVAHYGLPTTRAMPR